MQFIDSGVLTQARSKQVIVRNFINLYMLSKRIAAIAAGREELIRLHRLGELHDEMLHTIERDLDLQEIAAIDGRGP